MSEPTHLHVTIRIGDCVGCGFGQYVVGSAGLGEPIIEVDLNAFFGAWTDQGGTTAEAKDTLVALLTHELLHVAEEIIERGIDEAHLELALERWMWAVGWAHRHDQACDHEPAFVCRVEGGMPVGVECPCGWSVGRHADDQAPLRLTRHAFQPTPPDQEETP